MEFNSFSKCVKSTFTVNLSGRKSVTRKFRYVSATPRPSSVRSLWLDQVRRFQNYYLKVSNGIISYSYLSESTGLARAAFQSTDAIVANMIKIKIATGKAKCHHCKLIRSEYFSRYCCVR